MTIAHKYLTYRIYPSKSQEARLNSWGNSLRFLWNLAQEQKLLGKARPKGEQVYPSAYDQGRELKYLRKELPWLNDVPRHACDQVLHNLDYAWQRWFKRISGSPKFKAKNSSKISITETDPDVFSIKGTRLKFPKIGSIRIVLHRPLEGKVKSCTIKKRS